LNQAIICSDLETRGREKRKKIFQWDISVFVFLYSEERVRKIKENGEKLLTTQILLFSQLNGSEIHFLSRELINGKALHD